MVIIASYYLLCVKICDYNQKIIKHFQFHKNYHDIYLFVMTDKVNKCKSKSILKAWRTEVNLHHSQ